LEKIVIPSGEDLEKVAGNKNTLATINKDYKDQVTTAENEAKAAMKEVTDKDVKEGLDILLGEAKSRKTEEIRESFDTANDLLENSDQNTILPLFFIGSPTLIAICSLLKLYSDKTFRYFAFIF